MSDYSGSPSDHHNDIQPPKRKATQAGLDGHATGRSVKRRASKACQCCRSRKVRCNVTEHGAPCTNCRLDEVECIVSESRRKKSVSHSRAISEPPLPKHKQRFCLINDIARCRHAISDEGSVFGLAICGASNLSQSRGAFQPMTTVTPTPYIRLLLTTAENMVKMTIQRRKTQPPQRPPLARLHRVMLLTVYRP
jgi:hypothetical protein